MAYACDDLQVTFDLAGVKSIRAIINHIHEEKGVILGIGKKSHDENIILRDQKRKFNGINWIVSLCITEDHTKIDTLCRNASGYVKDVTGKTPTDHNGGFDPRKKKHHVFALVHRNIEYVDNCSERPSLVASVSAYIRENPKSEFYIGITSGPDAITAMIKRRTGDKYKDMYSINRMIAIFKSKLPRAERQQECRDVEDELVARYKSNPKNLNRIAGGGGKNTTQQWSFVYLGMHV